MSAALIVGIIAIIGGIVAIAATGSRSSLTSSSFAAASSYSYSSYSPSSEYSLPTTTATTITTYAAQPRTGSAATWTVAGSDDRAYSSSLTIAFDTPIRPSDASSSSVGRALVSCTADASTDALIPVNITLTNTTSGFTSVLGARIDSSYSYSTSPLTFEGDARHSDGNTCGGGSSYSSSSIYGVKFNSPIAPNAGASDAFFLVVHNYYSPKFPSGDVADLTAATFSVVLTFGDSHQSFQVHATQSGSGPTVKIAGA